MYKCTLDHKSLPHPVYNNEYALAMHYFAEHNSACLTLTGKLFKCPDISCKDTFQISAGCFCQEHFAMVHTTSSLNLKKAIRNVLQKSVVENSGEDTYRLPSFTVVSFMISTAVMEALFPETVNVKNEREKNAFIEKMPPCTQHTVRSAIHIQMPMWAPMPVKTAADMPIKYTGPLGGEAEEDALMADILSAKTADIPTYIVPQFIKTRLETVPPNAEKLQNLEPEDNAYVQISRRNTTVSPNMAMSVVAAGYANVYYCLSRKVCEQFQHHWDWCNNFPSKVAKLEKDNLPPKCLAKTKEGQFMFTLPPSL